MDAQITPDAGARQITPPMAGKILSPSFRLPNYASALQVISFDPATHIATIGEIRVRLGGMVGRIFERLAMQVPYPVHRAVLIRDMWPDGYLPADPRHNLGVYLHTLRDTLAVVGARVGVISDSRGLALVPGGVVPRTPKGRRPRGAVQ